MMKYFSNSVEVKIPQQGEVITEQTARCLLSCLGCVVELSGTDISHTLSSFIFQM